MAIEYAHRRAPNAPRGNRAGPLRRVGRCRALSPLLHRSARGRDAFSGPGGLTYVQLSNSWIIINVGGGPTDDKPEVTLETPADPNRVSSFLNIRVTDMHTVYAEWSSAGCSIPDAPEAAPVRDPLLYPRSRWSSDRGGANDGPGGGLVTRSLAIKYFPRRVRVSSVLRSESGGHIAYGAEAPPFRKYLPAIPLLSERHCDIGGAADVPELLWLAP